MLFKRWITAIVLIPFLFLILLKGNSLVFSFFIAVITLVSMKEYFSIASSIDFFQCPSDEVVSYSRVTNTSSGKIYRTGSILNSSHTVQNNTSLNLEKDAPLNLSKDRPAKFKKKNSMDIDSNDCEKNISLEPAVSSYFPSCSMPIKIKLWGYAASLLIIAAAQKGSAKMVVLIIALNIIIAFTIILVDFSTESNLLCNLVKEILGIVYIPVFLCFLVFIRNSSNGAIWIIWLWFIIAASDTGAYYFGTYFGKNPLALKISPHKTIEGSAGGLLAAVVTALFFGWIYLPDISSWLVLFFAIFASAAGQLGDLFESVLKRSGKIKDSGKLLPGHGGVLDRIDALIFAAPVAFVFKWLITNTHL